MLFDELGCQCAGCPLRPKSGSPQAPTIPRGVAVIAVANEPRAYGPIWNKALQILAIPAKKVATMQLRQCKGKAGVTTKPEYQDAEKRCLEGSKAYLVQVSQANPAAWIFAQGEQALRATTKRVGIGRWLGGPLNSVHGAGRAAGRVLPSYDPILLRTPRDKANTPIWLRHLKWVWSLATGELETWAWPETHIEWTPEAAAALERIAAAPVRACDIETSGVDKDAVIRCISFATSDCAICLPWDPLSPYHAIFLHILGDETKTCVWQNGGFDRGMLRRWGIVVACQNEDLMLLHAIMRPQEFHGLGHIAGAETWAEAHKAQFHSGKDEY
jgi:hypothetical protein